MFQPNVIINKSWQNLDTNPWERDQQARERLRQKAKIKSHAYIQLGQKTLQTVHQTFAPDIPVILHLPALTDTTVVFCFKRTKLGIKF